MASFFFHSHGYSQTSKITGKNKTEQVEKKDSIIEGNWLYMDSVEYNNKVSQLITEINAYRKSKNLCELKPDPILNMTAQEYADYCVKNCWIYGHVDKE